MSIQVFVDSDPAQSKILHKPSKRVKNPQDTATIILGQTMSRICANPGVAGIAANQVGSNVRMFALSRGTEGSPLFFINPKIVEFSAETVTDAEGCLSVPGRGGYVERAVSVTLKWEDHNRQPHKYTFTGFWARAVQHEMDHLDGILYTKYCKETFSEKEMLAQFETKQSTDQLEKNAEAEMRAELEALKKDIIEETNDQP